MFKKDNLEVTSDKVNTIIGKDTFFNGTIKGKGLIRIDGEAEGNINNQGDVVVGEGGRVSVEMKARNITIAGRYEGTLEAEGKLEIKRTGTAVGTFKVNALVIEEGAVLSGAMQMQQKDQPGSGQEKKEKSFGSLNPEPAEKNKQQGVLNEVKSKEKVL